MSSTTESAKSRCHLLRIPRELRNMIYQVLLDNNCEPEPFALEWGLQGCLELEMPTRRRNSSVGYYTPFYLRYKDSGWHKHFNRPVTNPLPIFSVCRKIRAEVLNYFKFGLEVLAEPGWQALESWAAHLREDTVLSLGQIYLFMSVGKHVFSQEYGVENNPWNDINSSRSPIIRLAIDDGGHTLTAKSCVPFIKAHARLIQNAFHAYGATLPSLHQFTGRNLIEAALLLRDLEPEIRKLDGAAFKDHIIAIGEDPRDFVLNEDDSDNDDSWGQPNREHSYQNLWAVEIAETDTKIVRREKPNEAWEKWVKDLRQRHGEEYAKLWEKKEERVLTGNFNYTIVEIPRHS